MYFYIILLLTDIMKYRVCEILHKYSRNGILCCIFLKRKKIIYEKYIFVKYSVFDLPICVHSLTSVLKESFVHVVFLCEISYYVQVLFDFSKTSHEMSKSHLELQKDFFLGIIHSLSKKLQIYCREKWSSPFRSYTFSRNYN